MHQIMFNELRGLIKDFNIQIEVETKGLKNHFEDLEKQLDYSKIEMSREIHEARCTLQNDIKLKLEEAINSLLKRTEINDDEVH